VYVSSLASNDFFSFEAPSFSFILPSAGVIVMLFYINNSIPNSPQYSQLNISDIKLGAVSAYKLYSTHVVLIVIFLIVYLLIALIVVAKNSSSSQGALRALKS
jgi:chromate transport protein ChrA